MVAHGVVGVRAHGTQAVSIGLFSELFSKSDSAPGGDLRVDHW